MKRVDQNNRAQANKFGAGKHGFQGGNPAAGILPTIPGADWFNHTQEEICNAIEKAGLTLNSGEYDQLYKAIKQIFSGAVVNNLTSDDADKPLSALMGKKLTEQIGALSIDSDLATRDLNTVNKAGLYGQTSSSNAQTRRNYPVVKAGSLLVMPSAYGVQQIYSVFDGTDIYARNQTGSGWTGWQKTNVSPGEMQSAVDTLERKLVNGSPAALDTIRELAAALGNDANFANKVLQQIAGKADKSSTRAGYGITDASEVAVLTGQLNHGGTIPLPPGYREDQCKWLVSMAEDDPSYTSWDISEGGLSKHYYYRCYTRGRTVIAKVYHGSSDQNPDSNSQGWVLGKVNYICIGVK